MGLYLIKMEKTVILLIETPWHHREREREEGKKEERGREEGRKEEKGRKKEIVWVARWCSGPDSKNWGLLFGHILEEIGMLRYI